jgi:hypothetical protein
MIEHRNFHQVLTWFLSEKSQLLDREGEWLVNMIAKSIAISYRALPITNIKLKSLDINIDIINEKDYSGQDNDYLQPVLGLKGFVNSQIKDNVVDFFIHGSLSTLDYVKGWSDFDTLVVVNSQTIENPSKLIELRKKLKSAQKYLMKIDPLQHHGFIFCSEFDLSQYLSHCMPVEVLVESKSLIRQSKLSIKCNRTKLESKQFFMQKVAVFKNAFDEGALIHHKYKGKYLLEDYGDMNTMYQMKYFLSVLMSLPALYLDALGIPSYKKDSFNKIKHQFGDEWEIIDKASAIRSSWAENEMHPYSNNEIPNWLKAKLGNNYFQRAYEISSIMSARL